MRKIAIFGANGFLAKSLALSLKKKKYILIGFSSKKISNNNVYSEINYFDLVQKKFSYKKYKEFKTAIIFSHSFENINSNVKGINKLRIELNKFNIRQIYISSHSAREDSYTDYGRSKFLIEQKYLKDDHEIIRPGLVIINGGLFKKYLIKIKKAPFIILPKIKNLKSFYIFENDFNRAIIKILDRKVKNTYNLFNEIKLTDFVKTIQKFNKINKKIFKFNFNIFFYIPFFKRLDIYKNLKNLELNSFNQIHKIDKYEKKYLKQKFNTKNLKKIYK